MSYYWSDSSTSATADSLRAGINYVTVTDVSGRDTVISFIIIAPAPMTLTPGPIDSICPADSNGTLSVSATSPNDCPGHGLSYAWSNGRTTASIGNLTPGAYTVTVSDDQGCWLMQQLAVPAYDTLVPDFTIVGNTLTATQSWPHYQWYHNGTPIPGANAIIYNSAFGGNYSLVVIDVHGCEWRSPLHMITGIAAAQVNGLQLGLFPNPAQGVCYLRTPAPIVGDLHVTISDVYGRQISQAVLNGLERDAALGIRGFAAGNYWVDVLTEDGLRQVLRLVVQ